MTPEEKEAFEKTLRESIIAEQLIEREKAINEAKKAAYDEAAKIEKDKLYKSLEKERNDAAEYKKLLEQKALEDAEKEKKIQEEIKSKMTLEERLKNLEDQNKLIADRSAQLLKSSEETFKKELEKRDLEVYRERLIAGSNGEIIPELVFGGTKEEIEQAVEFSKRKFAEIAENLKNNLKNGKLGNGYIPTAGKSDKEPINTGDTGNDGSEEMQSVFALSDADFAKYEKEYLGKFSK